jgi:cytochrome P450
VIVIAELLGLPPDDAPQLLDWSHRMVAMYQFNRTRAHEEAAVAATRDFCAYVGDHVERRRRQPADDLISSLIAARDHGDKLGDDELIGTIILLMNAGHEATVHAIGNGVRQLLRMQAADGAAWREITALLQSGEGATAIGEECLRYDPPLHLFTRYALQDMEISGQRFGVGDKVGLLLGAANRDPAVYARPDVFDATRYRGPGPAPQPMSFGAGIHFCIGAPLARLELQIAIPTLFARLPGLSLAGDASFRDSFHFHGLERLDATWPR